MIFKRFKCLLCDLGLIYLLHYCFCFVNPFRMPFVASYFAFLGGYFLITFFCMKRSLFQYLLGIEIKQKSAGYMLFKILFLCIIPFLLTFYIEYWGLVLVFIFLFLVNLFPYIRKRKSIWERCAHTKTTCSIQGKQAKPITCIILSLVIVVLGITTLQYVSIMQKGKETVASNSKLRYYLHANQSPLPASQIRQRQYIEDIKQQKQEPFEYIMQLFENHDIVVLCERLHPEYTQWQLFSQIIFNDTFALKVGNVATEFGRFNSQAHLDSLLNISFYSEKERKRAFAALIRENGGLWPLWSNTNIYDFAINLSVFNEKQETNRKINWFFCDVAIDWKSINNRKDWDNDWYSIDRDSIMAHNIATAFDNLDKRGKPSKLLVIANTGHVYKEIIKRERALTTADCLYQQYGDKVAFVWINMEFSMSPIFFPRQMGLLERAAAQIEDSLWALSFSSSIMGKDRFDLLPDIFCRHLKMKDVFDGMIFCIHPVKQYLRNGYDYILTDFIDTLAKRNKIVFEEKADEITQWEIDDYGLEEIRNYNTRATGMFYSFNIIYYFVHYFILFWLLGCLISILRANKRIKRQTEC